LLEFLNSTRTRGPPVRPVWPLPDRLQDPTGSDHLGTPV
jgi:hypothetical protein